MLALREVADNATTYDVGVLQQVSGELAVAITEHVDGATKQLLEKMLGVVSFELMMRADELSNTAA
jgi:hypothetical protein